MNVFNIIQQEKLLKFKLKNLSMTQERSSTGKASNIKQHQ